MAQKKGQTGNPNGRPKGTPNKSTAELKDAINLIVSNNIDRLQKDIDNLEAKDRLIYIEKLFKYCVPPLQAEAIEEVKPPQLNYMQLLIDATNKSKTEKSTKDLQI